MELRDQLQTTLGAAYTLDRELGGGGMSRVFVAREAALNRDVVVKVLPPDLAAGVSVDRFKREIQLAAALQHPHIVPVLSAGEIRPEQGDGSSLPYYTMPFVQGESLRGRLARAGALPILETVGILRDVAKALAYAHERGIVHRDIKPDNVLLSGGSATVTDFGIAKALTAAREEHATRGATLTSVGTSLGTPAYMAPEQAAADPDADHRADLYALGCMAYEMLAGRPPFAGRTPQKLLAAQMGERPQPVAELRADTPPLLAELVMRCLEKDADDRPQSAADLVRVLEQVTTSGGAHPVLPRVLLAGKVRLGRALAVWAAAVVAVAILARAAIVVVGLPAWVFPGALAVMALGLPVILFTAFVHDQTHKALTRTPTVTPGGGTSLAGGTLATIAVRASPHVTWRRTTLGGLAALAGFVLLVGGYMVLRALGIGPAGSLMAAGALGAHERLLVADFRSPASDTTLGPVVTEAFRSDLAQSPNLEIVQPTTVRDVLRRMERPVDARVDFALGREVATREGIKAVVDGEVLSLGGSYVIAAKLVAAQSGDVLASFRETAEGSKDIIDAIDRLSRAVRAKVGESLRSVNAARPLEQVTTPSLEALRKYVQAVGVFSKGADRERGFALLEEAIALDTGFAMAYRKLAVELSNMHGSPARRVEAIRKAYDHRDRLSEPERYLTEGTYWSFGPTPDLRKAIAAFDQLLEIQPDNGPALNNAADGYNLLGEFARAESYARRALATDSSVVPYYVNMIVALIGQGKLPEAERVVAEFERHLPASPIAVVERAALEYLRGQYDSAEAVLRRTRGARPGERTVVGTIGPPLAALLTLRGRLAEAGRIWTEVAQLRQQQGTPGATLQAAAREAFAAAWFAGNAPRAVATLEAALRAHPLDQLALADRPYVELATAYAYAGRPDRARAMLAAFDDQRHTVNALGADEERRVLLGDIAMAERRYADAAREYGAPVAVGCRSCELPRLARAYDLAGNADSALAVFRRYADQMTSRYGDPADVDFVGADAYFLAGSYKRLGELWEQKGDRAKAAGYYQKFIDLWKSADPALQPTVAEVRQRLARLHDTEARR